MPGKSRQARRKLSRKRKSRRVPSAIAAQQVVAQAPRPAVPAKVSAPSAGVPTLRATPTRVQYPYVISELRRIGILAGIILVILVVLALVLS